MSEKVPPGWGYAPNTEPQVRAPNPVPKSTRPRCSNDRQMHMRMALWAASLDHPPTAGAICDRFGVHYETARRLVIDFKRIQENP